MISDQSLARRVYVRFRGALRRGPPYVWGDALALLRTGHASGLPPRGSLSAGAKRACPHAVIVSSPRADACIAPPVRTSAPAHRERTGYSPRKCRLPRGVWSLGQLPQLGAADSCTGTRAAPRAGISSLAVLVQGHASVSMFPHEASDRTSTETLQASHWCNICWLPADAPQALSLGGASH